MRQGGGLSLAGIFNPDVIWMERLLGFKMNLYGKIVNRLEGLTFFLATVCYITLGLPHSLAMSFMTGKIKIQA